MGFGKRGIEDQGKKETSYRSLERSLAYYCFDVGANSYNNFFNQRFLGKYRHCLYS